MLMQEKTLFLVLVPNLTTAKLFFRKLKGMFQKLQGQKDVKVVFVILEFLFLFKYTFL